LISDIAVLLSRKVLAVRFLKVVHFTASLEGTSDDLQLSDSVYGFASGIFFFGYLLFEVPSNLLLEKIGARLWIARIMITWGIIS
jgi:ACS family tartrate transporter-like MFS transporter